MATRQLFLHWRRGPSFFLLARGPTPAPDALAARSAKEIATATRQFFLHWRRGPSFFLLARGPTPAPAAPAPLGSRVSRPDRPRPFVAASPPRPTRPPRPPC